MSFPTMPGEHAKGRKAPVVSVREVMMRVLVSKLAPLLVAGMLLVLNGPIESGADALLHHAVVMGAHVGIVPDAATQAEAHGWMIENASLAMLTVVFFLLHKFFGDRVALMQEITGAVRDRWPGKETLARLETLTNYAHIDRAVTEEELAAARPAAVVVDEVKGGGR